MRECEVKRACKDMKAILDNMREWNKVLKKRDDVEDENDSEGCK